MAVSLPPSKRKAPSEAQIEAIINKGGKPTAGADAEPLVKHFNIRLTGDILSQIRGQRAKRPRKPGSPELNVSTHDWIVEAILEKLKRKNR